MADDLQSQLKEEIQEIRRRLHELRQNEKAALPDDPAAQIEKLGKQLLDATARESELLEKRERAKIAWARSRDAHEKCKAELRRIKHQLAQITGKIKPGPKTPAERLLIAQLQAKQMELASLNTQAYHL